MQNKTLKEKCEEMRNSTDYRLPKKSYAMAMIDGRSFSKLIKNKYKKPFDDKFIGMMNEVAAYVCQNVQGCKFAYVQSDEITFVITDFETDETSAFFDYRLCKMLSIIPSLATAKFNQLVTLELLDTPCSTDDMKQMAESMKLVQFDCKCWSVYNFNDVFAYLLWRQLDCIRNSKQQTSQTYLPHRQLSGKTTDEQVELLLKEKNVDWNQFDDGKKYGRFIYKEQTKKQIENGEICIRNVWQTHNAFQLNEQGGRERLEGLNVIPIK